ncbi:MAG: type VI-B CRISPR-associated RNA-guided ribonuclease Cas13b, partial [Planctomycetia bacterium]|nr:type VI-B CRISPR-associated RNA-guided ribonuclease Cas13b [Planctomycetia bacterium]
MIYDSNENAFWAMNANMAINNILNVIQYATSVEGVKKKPLDDPGSKGLRANELFAWLLDTKPKNYSRNRKAMSRLLKCLPVAHMYLQYLQSDDPENSKHKHSENDNNTDSSSSTLATALDMDFPREKFVNYLKACIFVLYELRNYFSHHDHEMYKVEYNSDNTTSTKSHLYFLYTLLTANIRTVKARFYKDVADSETILFDPFRRHKGTNEDKTPCDNPNFLFEHFEYFDENEKLRIQNFTKQGLAFFLCQFLERKYASQMLQSRYAQLVYKPVAFGATQPAEVDPQLILRIFTVHSLHLPKPRLEMTKSQSPVVLGMDILNELYRCPGDLFELLTPTDQNKLRIPVEDDREILFRRHSDRFSYLALNYLDRDNKLGSIRFHIDMGPYYFDSYSKTLLDGSSLNDRRLGKRIRTFCQIQEAERLYHEERKKTGSLYWTPVEGQQPPKTYRVDMTPQYLIKNNQIGIRFQKGKYVPPQPNGRLTKNEKPECWLSLNELPFLVFLVTQEKQKEVQDCITSYMQHWKDILTKVLDNEPVRWHSDEQFTREYHVRPRDIPDELLYYFKHGNVKPFNASLRTTCIKDLIEKTESAIKRLKATRHDVKLGKDRIPPAPTGRIAYRIVRELLQYQPSNDEKRHQGKVTSPNFNLLQALLATYNHTKDNLYELFMRAGLLENPEWPHPFLGELLKKDNPPVSLSVFYSTYLERKLKYLEKCKNANDVNGPVHFLRQYDKRAQSKTDSNAFILAFVRKLLEEPVNLPRGLFETAVRNVIKNKFP